MTVKVIPIYLALMKKYFGMCQFFPQFTPQSSKSEKWNLMCERWEARNTCCSLAIIYTIRNKQQSKKQLLKTDNLGIKLLTKFELWYQNCTYVLQNNHLFKKKKYLEMYVYVLDTSYQLDINTQQLQLN